MKTLPREHERRALETAALDVRARDALLRLRKFLRRHRCGEGALRDQEGGGRHRLPGTVPLSRGARGQPGVHHLSRPAAPLLRRLQAVAARPLVPVLRDLPLGLSQHRCAVPEERRRSPVVRAEAARVSLGGS